MANTGGSKEQVGRLLTLVPYLHSRGSVRVGEAAEALGVTPEQLLKDLRVLFLCGLPGGYPDDLIDVDLDAVQGERGRVRHDGVITVGNADYLARPLRLTPTEASAMIVALRALRAGAGPETVEVVDRALSKLEAAAAAGPVAGGVGGGVAGVEVAEEAPSEPDVDPTLAPLLSDAAERGVQVELDYYTPARDELATRVVDPHGLAEREGRTYLDAWCHSAEAPRLFRLDRIAGARVLDTSVATPQQAPRQLDDGLFDRDDDLTTVTVRLAPAARWVVEYYPVNDVRPSGETSGDDAGDLTGFVDVDLQVADEGWLTRLLLRLAPHAAVVGPGEHGRGLTAAAQAALSLYDEPI